MRLLGAAAAVLMAASFSANAATILIDGDTAATGSGLNATSLITSEGSVSLTNGFLSGNCTDPDLVAAGASGNCFNIPALGQFATLSFNFDVTSISFV